MNAAVAIDTDLLPEDLLNLLHSVEADFGRERPSRWAPRSLDLDLIAYGDTISPDRLVLKHWMELPLDLQKQLAPEQMILPHPRMHERSFVLIPLADIAPDWRHPATGQSVREMVVELPESEKSGVEPLDDL